MRLYYAPGACSLAVHIALLETGVEAHLIRVDLKTHETEDGINFHEINPRGYVPALQLDTGEIFTEVMALLQFIAERAPESRLLPAFGKERLQVLTWMAYVSSELHKMFSPWLFVSHVAPSTAETIRSRLSLRFAELDQHLASRPFLSGRTFSIADIYAFVVINWAYFVGMKLDGYPSLVAFLGRVGSRCKVRQALAAEGLREAA